MEIRKKQNTEYKPSQPRLNKAKLFGRRIKRIERAFENASEYSLNKTKTHNPKTFIADAKIKKHYDIIRYHLLLEKAQETIAFCRAKYGKLGITEVVKRIIDAIK